MKINLSNSRVFENRRRFGITLLGSVILICLGLTQGAGQLQKLKRVTGLQLGDAAEGARVSVMSDSALNDYEAFRRGDRFYVRIPQAEFATGQPQFSGDGFEDVQVQKIGDSVVVSFKLQPGATARVDEHANRLDIIFSSPSRMVRVTSPNTVRNRVIGGSPNGRVRTNPSSRVPRNADVAGPVPPDSPETYTSGSTGDEGQTDASRDFATVQSRRIPNNGRVNNNATNNAPAANSSVPNTDSTAPSSPTTTQSYTPYNTGTSTIPVSSAPAANSPAGSSSSWKTRGQKIIQSISANRRATLIGAAALLIMIAAASLVYWRRKKAVKAKRAKGSAVVQPKYSPDFDLEDLLADEETASIASSMLAEFNQQRRFRL